MVRGVSCIQSDGTITIKHIGTALNLTRLRGAVALGGAAIVSSSDTITINLLSVLVKACRMTH